MRMFFYLNVDGQRTQSIIKNLNLKKSKLKEVLKSKFY